MFKFAKVMACGEQYVEQLFLEGKFIGTFGVDKEGAFMNLQQELTIGEMNLLIAQLLLTQPSLVSKKIEIISTKRTH